MKIVDFGFPEDKIPGTFHTNCPAWNVKIKRAKCKVSWALRLADEIYPYQLTADPLRRQPRQRRVSTGGNAANVGFLKKGGSGKSEIRGRRSEVRGQK